MNRNTLFNIAGLAFALGLSACGGKDEAAAKPADGVSAALAVQLTPVALAPLVRAITVSGAIAPWQDMSLGVELSGHRVAEVKVEVGTLVKRGEVLLTLDARTLNSELRQAKALMQEARSGVLLAQSQLDRGNAMKARSLISAADHDLLRSGVVQAQARAATTAAQFDAAQLRVDFATLRAPDDGVISSRSAEPGTVVMAGAELLRMMRQGRLEWRAEVSEADLAEVRVGAAVELHPRDGGVVTGTVRAVAPGLDATARTATVQVDVPAPGALRSGMFVEGRILVGEGEALTVPISAIVRRDGYAYVFVMKDKVRVERRRIELGRIDGERIEVRTGLVVGDAVVSRGGAFLADGDRVRVASGG